MRVIQRLAAEAYPGEILDNLIDAQKRHGGCFNEVWMCTLYGYPWIDAHRKAAELFAESAKKLREAGIRVSMQISNTLGHGEYMAQRDCSGLVYEGSPVRNMVGHDGAVGAYAFCWNNPVFREYILESTKLYVEAMHPEEIWIDDDYRAVNHRPVMYGCFCDCCIADFNQKHGTAYTRESLVKEILHGDINVRKNWIGFVRDGISSLTEEICKVSVAAYPNVRFGWQTYSHGCYAGSDYGYIFEPMYKVTGKTPMFRPGGGAFHDHDPNRMIDKMLAMSFQNSHLPTYVNVICPEVENLSTPAMGKTMHGMAMETSLYFAAGATDMSYAMLGRLAEPLSHHEQGFVLLAAQKPYWEKLAALSASTRADGICCAISKESHLRTLSDGETMDDLGAEQYGGMTIWAREGIPVNYTEACGVTLLRENAVKMMTDGEIESLLGKNVIADAAAVEEIQRRGFDLGFSMFEPDSTLLKILLGENYTDHPVNAVGGTSYKASFFADGDKNYRVITKIPDGAEILGVYGDMSGRAPFGITEDAPNGYASVVCTTQSGGRWAVFGYGLMKDMILRVQRDRLLNAIDYVGGGVGARLLSPHQAVVLPRVGADGKTAGVSVLNCTVGPEENVRLLIRNPKAEKFTFDSQYDGTFDLPYEKTEDGYIVTIPKLFPWSVGTVFVG